MKYNKILRTLALAIILALLVVGIPATLALAAPVITLSPTSGAIGTEVTVTGTNFDSYRGDDISIFFNDVEIANSSLTVPDTGSFSVNFNIPGNAKPGRAWITIKSQIGYTLAKSSFIIPETEVKLNVKTGTVGTVVTVDGKGFYANKMVTFYYYYNGKSEKLGTEVATPTGECSYSFAIPNSTAAKHRITAKDAQGNSAKAEFEVIPSTTLNPTSGAVGDILTVNGSGFGYRSVVTIYFKKPEVAYAKTDKYGCFEGIFKVPVMKPSTYEVKVEDEDDNTGKAEFTIIEVSLNKTTGSVGTPVIVSGSGFRAGETITIEYDDTEVVTATVKTDGTFSATFKVPSSQYGDDEVTISDGTITKQFTFTMESEAPPTPQPLLPELGVKAEQPVHFDWKDVDDPSGVTFTFQIATHKDFAANSIVLEKKDITKSEYTTEEEQLGPVSEKEPYYWRIRAIDGASNESEWSAPGSFYVGVPFALPGWAIYVLFGMGAIIIGYLGFRLGRRSAYYKTE
jgi:hypothetical protein